MKLLSLVSTLALASIASPSTPTYSATVLIDRATMICTLISPPAETQHHRAIKTSADVVEQTRLRQNRLPEELLVHEPYDMQQFLTVLGGSVEAVTARVTERCTNGVRADPEAEETKAFRLRGTASRSLADEAEIRKLVDSGDPLNRIDVVRMGDGYTATKKTKFYADMQRLTNDMFTGDTFAQYLPLFNIWTAHVPSVESGIGVGGKARYLREGESRCPGVARYQSGGALRCWSWCPCCGKSVSLIVAEWSRQSSSVRVNAAMTRPRIAVGRSYGMR